MYQLSFLSVHMEQLGSPTGRIFLKFDISFFKNVSRKIKCDENLTSTMGTLHEDLCTFIKNILLNSYENEKYFRHF